MQDFQDRNKDAPRGGRGQTFRDRTSVSGWQFRELEQSASLWVAPFNPGVPWTVSKIGPGKEREREMVSLYRIRRICFCVANKVAETV